MYDPVKNSEWERFLEPNDKPCPKCGYPMKLEEIEPEKPRFYICICGYTEAEDERD